MESGLGGAPQAHKSLIVLNEINNFGNRICNHILYPPNENGPQTFNYILTVTGRFDKLNLSRAVRRKLLRSSGLIALV